MPSKKNLMLNSVTKPFKFQVDLFYNSSTPKGYHPRNIFDHHRFRQQGFCNTDKILKKMITIIIQISNRCIYRKSLARWPAGQKINISDRHTKSLFDI